MTREQAEHVVRDVLFGAPGEGHETEPGRDLMLALLEEMGLAALTDAAVVRLAALHEQFEAHLNKRRVIRTQGGW